MIIFFLIIVLILPTKIFAQKGCCSWHGGVAGCSVDGRQICNDGTLSPSCTCIPNITYEYIYGCTDSSATNYNPDADKNDGSCVYEQSDSSNLLFLIIGGTIAGTYYFKKNKKS